MFDGFYLHPYLTMQPFHQILILLYSDIQTIKKIPKKLHEMEH